VVHQTGEPADFDSVTATAAAEDTALRLAGTGSDTVDLLIHAGINRSDLVHERALVTLVAGRLSGMARPLTGPEGLPRFDLCDGAVGFLRAYQVGRYVRSGQQRPPGYR